MQNNSPILTIPGISHFSGTFILAELGDLTQTFLKGISGHKNLLASHLTKYKSSSNEAQHAAITKKDRAIFVRRSIRSSCLWSDTILCSMHTIIINCRRAKDTDVPRGTVYEVAEDHLSSGHYRSVIWSKAIKISLHIRLNQKFRAFTRVVFVMSFYSHFQRSYKRFN